MKHDTISNLQTIIIIIIFLKKKVKKRKRESEKAPENVKRDISIKNMSFKRKKETHTHREREETNQLTGLLLLSSLDFLNDKHSLFLSCIKCSIYLKSERGKKRANPFVALSPSLSSLSHSEEKKN